MVTTEPMDPGALLHRLAELERENRELRSRLQAQEATPAEARPGSAGGAQADDSEGPSHVSERKLRQIADHLPALVAYVDRDQRYRFNNRAYETWIGRTPESLYGLHLWDAVGTPAYERTKSYIEAVLAGQRTAHEWWAPFRTGMRYVRSEYIPDRAEDGRIVGFYVLASDLTETKQSQAALAESEVRLRLAIDAGRMAVWEIETATDKVSASPELNRLLGLPPDITLSTEDIRARYYPGEHERLRAVAREALSRGDRHVETELRVVWPDGSLHWLLLRAELQDVVNGIPARTLGVALDITDMKKAEEHQQLLINELNHRVKNTLATVQSIASQSLRNAVTASEARDAVEGRLFALSRAHDVLTRESWDGADLREVVREAIAPFQDDGHGRFDLRGPDMRLPPRIALAIAMAIQELGTNAVKYGALSNEKGRIGIEWVMMRTAGAPGLELVWTETDGPPVVEPSRRGFGTRLIERSLAQELHGDVTIAFAPKGVVCTVHALLNDGEGDANREAARA
ncbi:sensor histidine kinase [Microvirga mediterraneensis]|uniref:Blue-light-activated histidine kinase n=1 Tax=Microvirga mediterraneensis TaxID=2754695 RepID=A0A838BNG1_9HYPH|nr:HWE histidine kinase domain-containing protein [Microvirga mediterraneensis]MBA1156609.1 PAS domain S-box protein [Microvirga mediterraneensis]